MKGILLCFVSMMLFFVAEGCQQQSNKQPLKVLFVGNDPGKALPPRNFSNGAGIAEDRYEEDMKCRMPSFEKLLSQYFSKVKTVDARDYREEMTRDYDVVIFDALPEPVIPGISSTRSESKMNRLLSESSLKKQESVVDTKELLSAHYFSDGYSKPTVFVGDRAGIMGTALGLKLNWFCRCLDAHAFDVKTEHPIFHDPLKVDVKFEKRISPLSALSGVEGVEVPGIMDMWRVQTEGYREGGRERYRQGLVATGDGFEENADAESIAGGVSDKKRDAVAIGRHGNFLMWGFAADPSYMTEEAQRVFVNAVCYISKFNGELPKARKYENGSVTRNKMRQQLALFKDEVFEEYVRNTKVFNEKLMGLKRDVENLKAAGKEVSGDLGVLAWPQPRKMYDREEFLKAYLKYEWESAGCRDAEEYRRYLENNMDYFYGGKGDYKFTVDQDLKELGIPIGDVKGLDRAIEWLQGTPQEREKGERLLHRYTLKDFSSAAEWRGWLDRERMNLFFTESCGYKFVEKGKSMEVQHRETASSGGMEQENPVKVTAMRIGNEVIIRFVIRDGFHIYASSGEAGAYILTGVEFTYPNGIEAGGELICPEGKMYEADEAIRIYEKEVVLKQPIKVDPTNSKGRMICTVTYQACDNTICLPPVTEEVEIMFVK